MRGNTRGGGVGEYDSFRINFGMLFYEIPVIVD